MLNWEMVFKQGLPVAGYEGYTDWNFLEELRNRLELMALIWGHCKLGEPQDLTVGEPEFLCVLPYLN